MEGLTFPEVLLAKRYQPFIKLGTHVQAIVFLAPLFQRLHLAQHLLTFIIASVKHRVEAIKTYPQTT